MTETPNRVAFTPERLEKVKEIILRYPEGRQKSALLPVLHIAQEQWGWVSSEVMDYVAEILNIAPVEVYEVASFYSMYFLRPQGKFVLEVCRTGPCCLVGAEKIMDYIGEKLGVTFPIDVERRIDGGAAVGAHRTSMLQDLAAGRPMEIDALVGSVQELGRITGTPTPTIDTVFALIALRGRVAGLY